jgi:hypothetical protein
MLEEKRKEGRKKARKKESPSYAKQSFTGNSLKKKHRSFSNNE